MASTRAQTELVERVRTLLSPPGTAGAVPDQAAIREVSMFGGRSFMVDDRMVVSALRHGALLVRVDPARHDELLTRPGTRQAEMGVGRSMGPGWIEVDVEAVATEQTLSAWLDLALAYRR